ncbi:MAG: thiaminase II [Tannerella sp.]|jgi:thiaminase/transcriptional activator TenA|nr:thiaminase II [Tannerella sp.]
MKWSEKAWDSIKPIYEKTLASPFIQELMEGTLDNERFIFYIRQDALYLSDYGKVLIAIATKLTKPEHIEAFIAFAGECIAAEKELHKTFLAGAAAEARKEQSESPSCLLYTSYLLRQLNAPVEVMAAAVLPCFRIYKEVGEYILANQPEGHNPYQAWINAYGGEYYEASVKKAIAICDELAESCTEQQQNAMTEAFITCSKLEWMFWDSAYHLEQWKV